jgi:uncharacterized protein
MSKDEVKIRISGLSNGIHKFQFLQAPSDFGLDGNFPKEIEVDAHLDKTAHQILLKIHVKTSGLFQCDRCLDEFEQRISASFQVVYLYNDAEHRKDSSNEIQVISPDTVALNLTEDIRQMILLSVPLKLLCSEECKGLCSRCGTNLNQRLCDCKEDINDPRWQDLKDLLNN